MESEFESIKIKIQDQQNESSLSKDSIYFQLAIDCAQKSIPVDSAYCVGAVLVRDNVILSTGYSRELPGNTHAEEVCLIKLMKLKKGLSSKDFGPIQTQPLTTSSSFTSSSIKVSSQSKSIPSLSICRSNNIFPIPSEPESSITISPLPVLFGSIGKGTTIYTTMEPCSTRLSGKKSCTQLIIQAQISRVVIGIPEPSTFVEKCVGREELIKAGIQVTVLQGWKEACLKVNDHLKF